MDACCGGDDDGCVAVSDDVAACGGAAEDDAARGVEPGPGSWWRDRALALPAASGLLLAAGFARTWLDPSGRPR